MLITLAILTAIASVDWSAIPDAVSEWLDAMDLAAETRE